MKYTLLLVAALFAVAFAKGQPIYFEDFSSASNNELPTNMSSVDADSDGNDWVTVDYGGPQGLCASSASWMSGSGALTPDNWMISPAIDLTGASGGIFLEWLAKAQDQDWADENYSVYVATADSIGAFTSSSTSFSEVIGATNDQWVSRTLDISSFAGQTIYLAFRHHNVTDQFRINIDDITVREAPDHEVVLEELDIQDVAIDGSTIDIVGTVRNDGANTITDMDVTWTDGSNTYTDNLSGLSIDPAATYEFTHSTPATVSGGVNYFLDVSVAITDDADTTNNSLLDTVRGLTFQTNNAVVIEEGTGTWCGWCPRGMIAMDYMTQNYGNNGFIGIAVHNGDPMALPEYDNGVGFSSYPGMNVNRTIMGAGVSSNNMELAYNIFIDRPELAEVEVTKALIGEDSTELTVDLESKFAATLNGNYRFAVVIMEDSVTGTSSGYDQVNYYAGGGNGNMGGYENLPDPVPADQMVYDHVGRMLLGGYDGVSQDIPTSINADEVFSTSFTASIPSWVDPTKLTAVGLLIDGASGEIINANKMEVSIDAPSSVEENVVDNSVELFPNPTDEFLTIDLGNNDGVWNATIYNTLGQQVDNRSLNLNERTTINVSELPSGYYMLKLNNGDKSAQSKFVIER